MNHIINLSQRIRANSEAAPWVVEEVKAMEINLFALTEANARTVAALRIADERVCAIIERTKPNSPYLADLLEVTYGLRDALKAQP